MKKLNLAIVALTLLLAFLAYAALEVRAVAGLTCRDMTGCCGAAGCEGPGTSTAPCSISCQGGGSVSCCSNSSGTCKCGGPGGEIGGEEGGV